VGTDFAPFPKRPSTNWRSEMHCSFVYLKSEICGALRRVGLTESQRGGFIKDFNGMNRQYPQSDEEDVMLFTPRH
jgi:hypothetical protein